jgi:hypothetical protein
LAHAVTWAHATPHTLAVAHASATGRWGVWQGNALFFGAFLHSGVVFSTDLVTFFFRFGITHFFTVFRSFLRRHELTAVHLLWAILCGDGDGWQTG